MRTEKQISLKHLSINPDTREVKRSGKQIKLRKKEYELLEFLARNKDRVLNRLTILEYVWNYSTSVESNTLEVHMAALRKKLDAGYSNKLLQTVHGLGYKLRDSRD